MGASTEESSALPRLVIASHNAGKVRELSDLARTWGFAPRSAASLDLPEPREDGESFEANAALKALAAARSTGLPALADDSGVVVAALGGAPGVRTHRWAVDAGGYDQAVSAALRAHDAGGGLDACYVCALAMAWPDDRRAVGVGELSGRLIHPGRGEGPGVWPFFLLAQGRTLAQLSTAKLPRIHPRRLAAETLEPLLRQFA